MSALVSIDCSAAIDLTLMCFSSRSLFSRCRFGSSTVAYAGFLIVGTIAAELMTNGLTDTLWEMNNAGRTYSQVDWSKFDPPDDDDDDEDDDDDDDEDDDDE